jgi:uncharacterized protein YjiS (DUF1127 family)
MSVGIQKTRALSGLRTTARATPALDISLKGLGSLIVKATDTVLDWQDRARQRHRLGEMDDHLLRDIGLSRADLEHEVAKPFWRD